MTPEELERFERSADELRRALEKYLTNERSEAAAEYNRPGQCQYKPPVGTVHVVTERIQPEKTQSTTDQADNYKLQKKSINVQRALCVFTALAFGAAAYYAFVAAQQRDAMTATLCEIQRQTNLMQREVEASSSAFVAREFRASWRNRMLITALLNNRGKSPATSVTGNFVLVKFSLDGSSSVIGKPKSWEFNVPGSMLPDTPVDRNIEFDISDTDFMKAKMMREAVRITGTFEYFNGFRELTDSVCYYLLGPIEFRNKTGQLQQTIGPNSVACDDLARIMTDYSQIRQDIASK